MPDTCSDCLREQIENNTPLFLRREIPIPCERHGNPADVSAQSLAWLQLYGLVRDSSELRSHEDAKTKKVKTVCVLNIAVLQILCKEIKVNFLEAFAMLSIINKAFNEG